MSKSFKLLGDPHMGRLFKTGVPLHRRGEREESQWRDFEAALDPEGHDLHIMMGDIFDKFIVAPEVVLRVYELYNAALIEHPYTTFVLLRGNHDVSRDNDKRSSFDMLEALLLSHPNVMICTGSETIDGFGFVGYDAFVSAEDAIAKLPDNLDAIFTHYDFVDFGGDHVLPTKLLAEKGITKVYNGHDHVARTETRDGVEVVMTGSMQPYTHAEDKSGQFYVTVTLDELAQIDATNLNVRVRLREGEALPTDLDCLSLTSIRADADDDGEVEVDTSEFESLEIRHMLAVTLDGLRCKDELMELYDAS